MTSVDSIEELEQFRAHAVKIMLDTKIELRQWEHSAAEMCEADRYNELATTTNILGLVEDKQRDPLSCEVTEFIFPVKIIKCEILSIINQTFDPIGFTCLAALLLKLMLQEAWIAKVGWDTELSSEVAKKFMAWGVETA